jgi:hypothetical protein
MVNAGDKKTTFVWISEVSFLEHQNGHCGCRVGVLVQGGIRVINPNQFYAAEAATRQENLCYDPVKLRAVPALGVAQTGHDNDHDNDQGGR